VNGTCKFFRSLRGAVMALSKLIWIYIIDGKQILKL
jgi:hypothetical protein